MKDLPKCRTDETYNQEYLDQLDAEFVRGYDQAVEELKSFFKNLDLYKNAFDIDGEDINFVRFLKNHKKIFGILKKCMAHWMEVGRDDMITTMLDNMDDEEYNKIKDLVDSGRREPYISG